MGQRIATLRIGTRLDEVSTLSPALTKLSLFAYALFMASRLVWYPRPRMIRSALRVRCVTQAFLAALLLTTCIAQNPPAPHAYTWQEVRDKFEATNPTLLAAKIGIDESKADEITAYLRPNPDLTAGIDQINFFSEQPTPAGGSPAYRPFAFAFPSASISYLHERKHKRELRRESAQKATSIAESQLADQERNLLFN